MKRSSAMLRRASMALQQLGDRLLPQPSARFQSRPRACAQAEDVARGLLSQPSCHSSPDALVAEAVDIEGVAADEIASGARLAWAAGRRGPPVQRRDHHRLLARVRRGCCRPGNARGRRRACCRCGRFSGTTASHLRDDVAGALDDDACRRRGCPCARSRPRCAAWRSATTTPPTVTGSSSATGVSAPVRPTWIVDRRSDGLRLLGRELVGESPSAARGDTKPSRACQVEPVRPCRRRRRCRRRSAARSRRDLGVEGQHLVDRSRSARISGLTAKPQSLEMLQEVPVRLPLPARLTSPQP